MRRSLAERRDLIPALLTGGAAAGAGALAAVSPLGAGVAALGAGTLFVLVALRERVVSLSLGILAVVLAGYAFDGRAFAHVGVPPIYAGEVALAFALLSLLFTWRRTPFTWIEAVLMAFMLLGLLRTVPFIGRDGIDAVRDATLWIYGLFVFAVARAIHPEQFTKVVSLYRSVTFPFILWVPILGILAPAIGPSLPTIPFSDVPPIIFKGGDMGVHLAGALAFALVGLAGNAGALRQAILLPTWIAALVIAGTFNRGGLLAANVGWAALAFMRPRLTKSWLYGVPVIVIGLAAIIAINPIITVRESRTLSLEQLELNVVSIFTDLDSSNSSTSNQGTKDFRLRWWTEIVNYTVLGPYFWTGKGFGVNLADDDGFQVSDDRSLRAPHNSHFTVLARMGVPGLVLWLTLIIGFVTALLVGQARSRRRGAVFWGQVQLWIAIYVIAMMVNTMFDPYLEGPQGTIWFWTLFGLGLAALRLGSQAPADQPVLASPRAA